VFSLSRFHPKFLDLFLHLGTTLLLVLFLHLPKSSLEGLIHRFLGYLALVAPIQSEAPITRSLLVTRFSLGVNLMLGAILHLEDNLKLDSITHCMNRIDLDPYPPFGTFLPKEIHIHLGGNSLNSTLLFPLTWASHIRVL
jgi:hypothetical protein